MGIRFKHLTNKTNANATKRAVWYENDGRFRTSSLSIAAIVTVETTQTHRIDKKEDSLRRTFALNGKVRRKARNK